MAYTLSDSRFLPSVLGYFTLGKYFIGKGSLPSTFSECRVSKSTRQIKNRKNPQNNIFFKLWEQLSNHYPLPYPSLYHFHYYFESNLNVFVNGEIRTH
jgi:hypothetical protein